VALFGLEIGVYMLVAPETDRQSPHERARDLPAARLSVGYSALPK
jgi:hypothetical protein